MMLAGPSALLIGLGWAGGSDARAIFKIAPRSCQRLIHSGLVEGVVTALGFIGVRTISGPIQITGGTAAVPLHFATAFWVGPN